MTISHIFRLWHNLMWHMQRVSKYVFLSRPRRFGKSLLATTLCSFFEGRHDLFEGLKVMALERERRSYPMLHIDMSMAKGRETVEELRRALMLELSPYVSKYGRDSGEGTPASCSAVSSAALMSRRAARWWSTSTTPRCSTFSMRRRHCPSSGV